MFILYCIWFCHSHPHSHLSAAMIQDFVLFCFILTCFVFFFSVSHSFSPLILIHLILTQKTICMCVCIWNVNLWFLCDSAQVLVCTVNIRIFIVQRFFRIKMFYMYCRVRKMMKSSSYTHTHTWTFMCFSFLVFFAKFSHSLAAKLLSHLKHIHTYTRLNTNYRF